MVDPAVAGIGEAADPIVPASAEVAGTGGSGRAWRRGAARNAAANGVARIVSIGTSFLLTPLILGAVGTEAFGLWILIGSIVAYASLLDLGIGGAVTKYVAEHRARGETTETRAVIGTGLRLYLAVGAVVALLGVAISPLIPGLLGVPPDLVSTATATTAAMSIGLGIAIPCATATAVLRGLQRYDLAASIAIVGSVLSAGLTLLALALGWGIVGIVVIGIPVPVLTQLLAFAAVRRIAPDLTTGPRPTVPGTARRIFGFSWPLFLLDVAGRLQAKSDEIVVGVVLSLGAVTPYALGRKLAAIPRLLAEQFAMVLLPRASELDATAEHARLRKPVPRRRARVAGRRDAAHRVPGAPGRSDPRRVGRTGVRGRRPDRRHPRDRGHHRPEPVAGRASSSRASPGTDGSARSRWPRASPTSCSRSPWRPRWASSASPSGR